MAILSFETPGYSARNLKRCPGCGGMVAMPCMLCSARGCVESATKVYEKPRSAKFDHKCQCGGKYKIDSTRVHNGNRYRYYRCSKCGDRVKDVVKEKPKRVCKFCQSNSVVTIATQKSRGTTYRKLLCKDCGEKASEYE